MTDPYRLLGIPATADDDTIRAAYLAAIRDCPPERDRARFERIRGAYESIATEEARLNYALFDKSMPTAEDVVEAVLPQLEPRRPDARRLFRVLGAK